MLNKDQFQKVQAPLGYIMAEPKPTPEELTEFYRDMYYQSYDIAKVRDYESEELSFRYLQADLVIHALKQNHTTNSQAETPHFLEIGCGEGFLFSRAAQQGWDVKGVDFSNFAIQKFHPEMMKYVTFGDAYAILENLFESGQTFDFCVMQNVLEHVIDPEQILHNIRRILKPQGICMFIVPNDYSPLQHKALAMGLIDQETWWAPPDHLTYFNIQNGMAFVESLGFKVVDVFSTFPIDFFLFHPDSNYYKYPERGKAAYWARIHLDLLMAEAGIDKYYEFCRALAGVGMGRNFALMIQPDVSQKPIET